MDISNSDIKIIVLPNEKKAKEKQKKIQKQRKITNEDRWKSNINETDLNADNHIQLLHYLEQSPNCEKSKIIRRLIKQKIEGYHGQDTLKNKLNKDKFVTYQYVLDKLNQEKLTCYYCLEKVLLLYSYAHDQKQWTLERIDNNFGHNYDNVEISCLKCNIKRRTMAYEKYKFTKQVKWIKES
jgi:hypothetical protein